MEISFEPWEGVQRLSGTARTWRTASHRASRACYRRCRNSRGRRRHTSRCPLTSTFTSYLRLRRRCRGLAQGLPPIRCGHLLGRRHRREGSVGPAPWVDSGMRSRMRSGWAVLRARSGDTEASITDTEKTSCCSRGEWRRWSVGEDRRGERLRRAGASGAPLHGAEAREGSGSGRPGPAEPRSTARRRAVEGTPLLRFRLHRAALAPWFFAR
ncbi:hypothetical protein U9M48_014643 [Paspalum notatum var. saurae]|uniref:Uncharacterized protein n=1 Tax=Paspalum notatum var. saurae TaxID=547442 RepID=A0AAQ3WKX3_PASNO